MNMNRTMTFENGRVIIRGGGEIPVIEPVGEELSAEELQALFKKHGFSQEAEARECVNNV